MHLTRVVSLWPPFGGVGSSGPPPLIYRPVYGQRASRANLYGQRDRTHPQYGPSAKTHRLHERP